MRAWKPGCIGYTASTQVRGAATLIVSAVRLAAARANTTGRPARLVFDFDEKRLLLEESVGSHFARSKTDVAGGAEASPDVEKAAREESERVLEGPDGVFGAIDRAATDEALRSSRERYALAARGTNDTIRFSRAGARAARGGAAPQRPRCRSGCGCGVPARACTWQLQNRRRRTPARRTRSKT